MDGAVSKALGGVFSTKKPQAEKSTRYTQPSRFAAKVPLLMLIFQHFKKIIYFQISLTESQRHRGGRIKYNFSPCELFSSVQNGSALLLSGECFTIMGKCFPHKRIRSFFNILFALKHCDCGKHSVSYRVVDYILT